MPYTSSFHHGTEVVLGHNKRDKKHVDKEPHIDPNGLHETWIDEPIEKAYERIFGEAVKEYNAGQKRADRKIKSYLQNVRQNSKLHDRYEFIVQVGNEKIRPSVEDSKTVLKEYLEDFKKRNKTLEVIGAYFHADEVGQTPHLHVDYIPKGKGNKTGLKVRNNLSAALKELGYETEFEEKDGHKKMLSAEMKFQNAEREALNEICKAHGLEIENPNLSPDNYCSSKQLREARNVRLSNEKKEAELARREENLKTQVKNANEKLEKDVSDAREKAETRSKELDGKESRLNEKEQNLGEREAGLASDKKKFEADKKSFTDEKKAFEQSKAEAEAFLKQNDDEVKPLLPLEKITNIGTAEKLEKNFPLKKTGILKKENPFEYCARLNKNIYNWFCTKFYNPLKDKCNKLLNVVHNLKIENGDLKYKNRKLDEENKALNQSTDKIVADRLKERSESISEQSKQETLASVKNKTDFYDNFFNGMKTTIKFSDGFKFTCLTGANSIRKMNDELYDLESLTPAGLENLARRMRSRNIKNVQDAVDYAQRNNLASVTEISEYRNLGFSRSD